MSEVEQAWNPRGTKPTEPTVCEIRCFHTVEMVSEARWDGRVWRYLTTGRECYIQTPEWRPTDSPKFA